MKNIRAKTIAMLALVALGGCGGGASSQNVPTLPATGTNAQTQGSVALTIKIPLARAQSQQGHSAKYMSPAVQGVAISAINAPATPATPTPGPSASPQPGAPSGFNFYPVSAAQPYCQTSSAALTCTLELQAPAGNDLFTVTTYDAPNFSGLALSTGTLTAQINAGGSNTINVATSGVPQWGTVGIANPEPALGATSTTNVAVNLVDADGYTIVGSYDAPVNLVALDYTGLVDAAFTFSKNALSQNSDTTGLTMTYNGAAVPAGPNGAYATIYIQSQSPQLGGLASNFPSATNPLISEGSTFYPSMNAAVPSPASLTFAHANSAAQTVSLTEDPNNTNSGSVVQIGNCGPYVTLSGSGLGPYTVTPTASNASIRTGVGDCDLTTAGGAAHSWVIPVMIQP